MTMIDTQLPERVVSPGAKGGQNTDPNVALWNDAILHAQQNNNGVHKLSNQIGFGKDDALPSTPRLEESLSCGVKNWVDTDDKTRLFSLINIAYLASNGRDAYSVLPSSQEVLQNKSTPSQNPQLHVCPTESALHIDVMELQLAGCVVRMTIETSDHDQVIRSEKINSLVAQLCFSNQEFNQRENICGVSQQLSNHVDLIPLPSQSDPQQSSLNVHVEWNKDALKVWIGVNQQDAKVLAVAEQLLRWIALHFPLTSVVCNGKEISLGEAKLSEYLNHDYATAVHHFSTLHGPTTQNHFSNQFGAFYVD